MGKIVWLRIRACNRIRVIRLTVVTVEVEKCLFRDWYGLAKPVVLGRFNSKMGVTTMVYSNGTVECDLKSRWDKTEGRNWSTHSHSQQSRGSGPASHLPHAMTTISIS